jgi:hypothetical protein
VDAVSNRGAERAALIESLEALLRPLMPLVLNYGVTYSDVQEVLRALFIDELSARIKEQGRPVTSARLGVFSGINRGEVEKINVNREQRERLRAEKAARVDQASRVLSIWHDDPRFNTPYGAPLDLSISDEKGFKTIGELFETAGVTVDRDQVIDEMVAAGSVEIHSGKFLRCTSRTFAVTGDTLPLIARIGRHSAALSATLAHNVLRDAEQPAYFERHVITNLAVSPEFYGALLDYFRAQGAEFLESCDRWISERERDYESQSGKFVGLGMYFIEESKKF